MESNRIAIGVGTALGLILAISLFIWLLSCIWPRFRSVIHPSTSKVCNDHIRRSRPIFQPNFQHFSISFLMPNLV